MPRLLTPEQIEAIRERAAGSMWYRQIDEDDIPDLLHTLDAYRAVVEAGQQLNTYEDFGEQMARCEHCGVICITDEHQTLRRALYEALVKLEEGE